MDAAGTTVIWERDRSPVSRRWWRWALPVVGVLIAFGIVSEVNGVEGGGTIAGFGAVLGVLLVLGPWIMERRDAAHPTVSTDGTHLIWAGKRVEIARIGHWQAASGTSTVGSTRITATRASFTLDDGSTTVFAWQGLGDDQTATLRAALERTIGRPPLG